MAVEVCILPVMAATCMVLGVLVWISLDVLVQAIVVGESVEDIGFIYE